MNPKIGVYSQNMLKFHFDNGLSLRAQFLPDKTLVRVYHGEGRKQREIRSLECECRTADSFADVLHEISTTKAADIRLFLKHDGTWSAPFMRRLAKRF